MLKSIILKEWLKTRRVFLVLLAVMTGAAIYTVMKINAAVESHGIVQLWLGMLYKDISFTEFLNWLPVACGIAIGVAQYVPEMSHYRLKLTLHLPIGQNRLVGMMLAMGVAELALIFMIQLAIVAVYYGQLIHPFMLEGVVMTLVPRYMAGVAAYLLSAAIILEGRWSRRLLLAIISVVVIMIFSQNLGVICAYGLGMTICLVLFLLMAACLVFGSVIRFKEGLRD